MKRYKKFTAEMIKLTDKDSVDGIGAASPLRVVKFLLLFFVLVAGAFENKVFALERHSGADFLKIGANARAASLGDVQAADPATDFFYNPAAPAALILGYSPNKGKRQRISFSHISAIEESELENFSYTTYGGRLGFISVGVMFFHVKPIPVTLDSPDPIGELVWRDFAFSLGVSRKIISSLVAGLTLKYIYRYTENPIFGKTEGRAYAADGGVIFNPLPDSGRLLVGAAFTNYGTLMVYEPKEPKSDELPFSYRAGLKWTAYSDGFDEVFLLSDIVKAYGDDKYRPQFAAELSFRRALFLRGGYVSSSGDIEGVCLGFGYDGGFYSVDISNRPSGDLGRSSAVTVSIKW